MYCGKGATAPAACPAGMYCLGDGTGKACPAGSYCPAGSTVPLACPAGSYCPAGSAVPLACPAGSYCPGPAQASATPCPAGSVCPAGSIQPTECSASPDPQLGYLFCPPGSETAVSCPVHFYCTDPGHKQACPASLPFGGGGNDASSCMSNLKIGVVNNHRLPGMQDGGRRVNFSTQDYIYGRIIVSDMYHERNLRSGETDHGLSMSFCPPTVDGSKNASQFLETGSPVSAEGLRCPSGSVVTGFTQELDYGGKKMRSRIFISCTPLKIGVTTRPHDASSQEQKVTAVTEVSADGSAISKLDLLAFNEAPIVPVPVENW